MHSECLTEMSLACQFVYVVRQLLNDCGIGLCTEATETPVVNQHRVLLFCQLKMMLDIVEQDLLKYIKFSYCFFNFLVL